MEIRTEKLKLLVVDDQLGVHGSPHQNAFIRSFGNTSLDLVFESCLEMGVPDAKRALSALEANPDCGLVLLDIKFGSADAPLGYQILRDLTARFPAVPVLIMSSVERDVAALGRCLEDGAFGFVSKSEPSAVLRQTVDQTVAMARSHVLLGQSPPLRELRRQAARLSPYDQIPVLIIGERGTGKERVARYIHHNGPRSTGPFVAVNCAGLAESLLESELFGAEKGAYTGADTVRAGYLERSGGGILFLDEIGNMPVGTQAKLLRALQDHTFRRVGVSSEELTVDFQVVCATNEEPETLIAERRLREDLYDRVAAVSIRTPALRDCKEDIPELARHFLRQLGVQDDKHISGDAMAALKAYDWPGNVRELRRVVQEAVVISESAKRITKSDLPGYLSEIRRPRSSRHDAALRGASELPDSSETWPNARLLAELRLAVDARHRIEAYKHRRWKAEFMRLMYPDCKAQNAKGFDDLIRRLTRGPWGSPRVKDDPEGRRLLRELTKA